MPDLETSVNSAAPKPSLLGVLATVMAIFVLSVLGFVLARSLQWVARWFLCSDDDCGSGHQFGVFVDMES